MRKVIVEKKKRNLRPARIRFKMNAKQLRILKSGVKTLGVTDVAAFVRGAIISQLEVVQRADNPSWLKFQAAVNSRALRRLGHPFELQTVDEVLRLGRLRP